MIDLFGPNGKEPQNMDEVLLTIKELQYSSRTQNQSRQVADRHYLAHLLHHVVQQKASSASLLPQVTKQLCDAAAPAYLTLCISFTASRFAKCPPASASFPYPPSRPDLIKVTGT